MDKLSKIYNGVFITLVIVVVYILIYKYYYDDPVEVDYTDERSNKDLSTYIKKEIKTHTSAPPTTKKLVKSVITGIIRGALMGLILNGVEGAIASALVLGTINPIITYVEYKC
jgi:hypothetical protein